MATVTLTREAAAAAVDGKINAATAADSEQTEAEVMQEVLKHSGKPLVGLTNRWKTAPGLQNLPHRPQPLQSADGKIQFDTSHFDKLRLDGEIWEEWHDSKLGDVMQVEFTLSNQTAAVVKQVAVDIEPAQSVLSQWNLLERSPASYCLSNYWAGEEWMGGLQPGVTLYWGAMLKRGDVKVTLRPYDGQTV